MWCTALCLCTWLAACVPSFDAFSRVDADGGPFDGSVNGRDASTDAPSTDAPFTDAPFTDAPHIDSGPIDCDRGLIACATRCADLMVGPTVVELDGDTGGLNLRPLRGGARLEDGHLVIDTPETWLLSSNTWSFGTAMACAEVELVFEEIDTWSAFMFGLRGPEHGMLARLRAESNRAQIATFEPDLSVLDDLPFVFPAGPERYLVQTYVTDEYAHAEVRNLSTGQHAVLHGTYRGAAESLQLELSFDAIRGSARVDWLEIGRPTTAARAIMERPR